ncbi:MAG: hypothetical protein LBI39_04535 [Puniceicoccales bacterium]|jgi:hypothetical protein|nr:hypothetical protein [Puniceicoccales bacterium]
MSVPPISSARPPLPTVAIGDVASSVYAPKGRFDAFCAAFNPRGKMLLKDFFTYFFSKVNGDEIFISAGKTVDDVKEDCKTLFDFLVTSATQKAGATAKNDHGKACGRIAEMLGDATADPYAANSLADCIMTLINTIYSHPGDSTQVCNIICELLTPFFSDEIAITVKGEEKKVTPFALTFYHAASEKLRSVAVFAGANYLMAAQNVNGEHKEIFGNAISNLTASVDEVRTFAITNAAGAIGANQKSGNIAAALFELWTAQKGGDMIGDVIQNGLSAINESNPLLGNAATLGDALTLLESGGDYGFPEQFHSELAGRLSEGTDTDGDKALLALFIGKHLSSITGQPSKHGDISLVEYVAQTHGTESKQFKALYRQCAMCMSGKITMADFIKQHCPNVKRIGDPVGLTCTALSRDSAIETVRSGTWSNQGSFTLEKAEGKCISGSGSQKTSGVSISLAQLNQFTNLATLAINPAKIDKALVDDLHILLANRRDAAGRLTITLTMPRGATGESADAIRELAKKEDWPNITFKIAD